MAISDKCDETGTHAIAGSSCATGAKGGGGSTGKSLIITILAE